MHINIINAWANHWRYKIGVNVIPADSINKRTWIKWTDDPRGNWQIEPIPQAIHEEWIRTGAFENGIAVICGKVLHIPSKSHLYLCAIDLDNKLAIEKLHSKGLKYLSSVTMVEQHDNPDKAHVYFYTTKPMPKKSSDATNKELLKKMKDNVVPAIEMKGEGKHGIMYCTPSPHKDGSRYTILGIDMPVILDEIGDVIDKICDEYSLGKDERNMVPMKLLMDNDTKIMAGNNRHEGVLRVACSFLRKYPNMEKQLFKDMIMLKNKRMCDPPLSESEIDKQIKDAENFISKQIEKEKELVGVRENRFGTNEFWSMVDKYKTTNNPKGLFIKCLDCNEMVESNPLNQTHSNHRAKIDTFK